MKHILFLNSFSSHLKAMHLLAKLQESVTPVVEATSNSAPNTSLESLHENNYSQLSKNFCLWFSLEGGHV